MDLNLVFEALQRGGPVGMAAIFCVMWWLERKDRKAADAELYDLATASIESSTKTHVTLEALGKQMSVCSQYHVRCARRNEDY
jgi:hypothetical protein